MKTDVPDGVSMMQAAKEGREQVKAVVKPTFIRWDCGCIGFPTNDPKEAIIVEHCDCRDEEIYNIHRRDMSAKMSLPLASNDCKAIIKDIGELIADGYKLRELKLLLK